MLIMKDIKNQTASDLLFNRKKYRLIRFLVEKEGSHSITEISEGTELSRQFVSDKVDKLAELGIVKKEIRGNMKLISINNKSAYYKTFKNLMKLDSKPLKEVAEDYAEKISEKHEEIESVILFGSVARETPKISSDIDVLVILDEENDKTREEIIAKSESFNKKYNVNLSTTFYEREKFLRDLKASRTFAENIVDEGEILAGEKIWEN